jgi:hypothetical protein
VKREGRKASLRCAIYTRVSTENGLEQEFNSLDNQREASEAYIKSQAHEGWKLIRDHYDDGGFSGGSMDRPALAKLLDDVRARKIDVIVVYKVDRLTRSLADFAKLVELFDEHDVSFISVTQAFNTPPAWDGSPSICCFRSRSSNAKLRASESGTKSPLQRRGASGWAARFHSVIGSKTARFTSLRSTRNSFETSSSATLSLAAWCD